MSLWEVLCACLILQGQLTIKKLVADRPPPRRWVDRTSLPPSGRKENVRLLSDSVTFWYSGNLPTVTASVAAESSVEAGFGNVRVEPPIGRDKLEQRNALRGASAGDKSAGLAPQMAKSRNEAPILREIEEVINTHAGRHRILSRFPFPRH